jgi:hypothetical protein
MARIHVGEVADIPTIEQHDFVPFTVELEH